MADRERIFLAVGPLPPPIGGDTVSFTRLVESRILANEGIKFKILDTSRKVSKGKNSRKLDFKDFINGISFFLKAIKYSREVEGVLLWSNSRFSYTLGLFLTLLFRLKHKKVILKLFGTSFIEKYNELPKWYQFIVKTIFSKINYILPETFMLFDFFHKKLNIKKENLIHFPNFLPFEPLKVRKINHNKDALKCIFVGHVKREKGIYDILKVLDNNQSIHCDFFGPIFKDDEIFFKNLVENLSNANYKGELLHTEVIKTISNYDFLLIPSFYPGEGYPGVVMEAYFAGVPVVVTKWRSLPEIVKDGENGFVVNINSPDEITSKLMQIKENMDQYMLMCESASKSALKFTEQHIIANLLLPIIR